MDIEKLRRSFPTLQNYTYLNTASSGLLSTELLAWRKAHDADLHQHASVFRDAQYEFLEEVRATVAQFFNASVDQTYLVPNFSWGIKTLATFWEGGKVLLLEDDYPSLWFPFKNGSFEIETVALDHNVESHIWQRLESGAIDILALSLVHYIRGLKIDQSFLKRVKAAFPEVLIVADGTQYLGTEPFDFEDAAIDALIASGYKWLLGGYGCGFTLLKGNMRLDTQELKMRMEPGHLDSLSFGSLKFALDYLNELGMQQLQVQIQKRSEELKEVLLELGLLSEAFQNRKGFTSIYSMEAKEGLYEHLASNGIITSVRGNSLRISVHWYNTTNEIVFLKKVLSEIL